MLKWICLIIFISIFVTIEIRNKITSSFSSPDGGGLQISNMQTPIISPDDGGYNIVEMEVSAYCPCKKCCGRWADGRTYSEYHTKFGGKFIAAPSKYKMTTVMDVPGYGIVPVLDRGGAIKDNKIDIFFADHNSALIFGRQNLKVKVYK